MQQILDLLDEVDQAVHDLADNVNHWLGKIPSWASWVGDKIMDAWNWLMEKAQEFWDNVSFIAQNLGEPGLISSTASSWNTSVGGTVSAQVQVAEAGNLEVDDTWTGSAAQTYAQRISLHKTALDKIKSSMTDGITTALDAVKTGIYVFWAAMVGALLALIAGIVGALASSATIFGIPAGIFIAAGAYGIALGAIWGGGTKLKSDCTSARNTLEQKVINENTGFLNGHWPAGAVS
ncbi:MULTISPECIES: hypothetical protein [unclassified Actinotalea]|uniref:hypothetical protein n=1 Tax=unclassified Actinotalea TaxID=2638618 RepID=UPI0015F4E9A7|nr:MULTISPECIES: hypothetical protein [unclassified Actinotalea]